MNFTVLDHGVDQGGILPGVCTAHEEVVLEAELQGADFVFELVGVEIQTRVKGTGFDLVPLVPGIGERFAELAGWQGAVRGGGLDEGFELIKVGQAASPTDEFATAGRSVALLHFSFYPIEVLDLEQDG